MAKKRSARKNPSWNDVKSRLKTFDEPGLLGLIKDLYAANKDNKAFLHARLCLGDEPIAPYKETISRWINPDVMTNQPISVSKAKKAISDYKKAIGDPTGMAELTVFYCEEVFAFFDTCGMEDEGYYAALVNMFEQALKKITVLPEKEAVPFLDRIEVVRNAGQHIGYGVGATSTGFGKKQGWRGNGEDKEPLSRQVAHRVDGSLGRGLF